MRSILILTAIFIIVSPVNADLYKWVDENGVTHYSDTPVIKESDKKFEKFDKSDTSKKTYKKQAPDQGQKPEKTEDIVKKKVDNMLLKNTIAKAKASVIEGTDININYDEIKKEIYIKFALPISKKINYADMWRPWRVNQWLVLQKFKRADVNVDYVTVETNYPDGSGIVKATHKSKRVDKYATLPNDRRWLETGRFFQKKENETEWSSIDY